MDSKNKPKKALKIIAQPEAGKNISGEIKDDALKIIRDAINSSLAALIITDLEGLIIFANPAFCKMFDYFDSEIIGKDSAELFSKKKIDKIVDIFSFINGSESTKEFIVEKKSGETFVVEASASSVTSVSGERMGRMASFIEITERKILESELENKLKEALDRINILQGILPICASCKKIRDGKGNWHQIEVYIRDHSEATFSHGICPACAKKLYPKITR